MSSASDQIRGAIRDVPDFPEPGVLFKDITPVLADPALLRASVDLMVALAGGGAIDTPAGGGAIDTPAGGGAIDKVVGIDARGFIFGALVAQRLDVGFVPARKVGKLPYETRGVAYDLEYGSAGMEMHVDAISAGDRVLLADDLLATGWTAAAALDLITQMGGIVVASVFLIELTFLGGRSRLDAFGPVHSIVSY